MGINVSDFRVAIRIDNSQALPKLEQTKNEISKLTQELKQMDAAGQAESSEYKQKKALLDELNRKYYELRKEVGLQGMTYNELRKNASKLRAQLNNTVPGTEKWKQLQADLKIVDKRMKEVRGTAQSTGLSLGKVADGFNRYAAIGASAIATLTGLTLTVRGCVNEFAKMKEAESQVTKYTGMAAEEVNELNEEFKKLDTRTTREELNELAGTAGRLGIQSKKDVLEFVEAADMIQVALGEDLGDDAIKNIGKLADMFGDSSRSMKENMLAIGSAVNSVAQNSSAAEPYLVEFSARMGGVAKQAKLSITDVMGFASALDQNMLRSEMASTALSSLIMKIYQDPAKYAKLAGMDVKEFTDTMSTDVNKAILMFLESLNKLGGMDKMAPVLKQMKLSGAEAAGVISTLAGNVAKVKKEQTQANTAFVEGTSIINEFNVQNNTVQAELDKAKKHFSDIRVELGEKLLPVMRYMVSTGSLSVKTLSAIVQILFEYKGEILAASTAVAAYTLYVNGATLATKAYEGITKLATMATNLFSKATKKSPWGLLIAGVTAAVSYFAIFREKTDEQTAATKRLNSALDDTQARLNRMAGIKLRGDNLDTLNDRQKQDLKADAQSEIRVIEDKLATETALFRKYYQEQKKLIQERTNVSERDKRAMIRALDIEAEDKAKELAVLVEEKKSLQKLVDSIPTVSDTPTVPTNVETPSEDAYNKRLSALERQQAEEELALKKFRADGTLNEESYQKGLYDIDIKYLSLRKKLQDEFGMDSLDTQSELLDKMIAESNRVFKGNDSADVSIEEEEVDEYDAAIDKFKESIDGRQAILEAQHQAGLISEAEYQDKMAELNAERLDKEKEQQAAANEIREAQIQGSLQVVSDLAGSFSALFSAMQDGEIQKIESKYDKQIELAKKAGKDTSQLEEEKESAINAIKKKYADKQFAAAVLQVTATTAITAMEAYKAMAGIPVVGPALGAAAAAAAVIAGAAQIAVAKQQRDQAKGLKSGGYSSDYVEGYTSNGNPNDVAGVIPVHKNEWVANHYAVANPHVKRFLDVFDLAQKDGSIRWMNTTHILEKVRMSAGLYKGGYVGNSSVSPSSVGDGNIIPMLMKIISLLETGNSNSAKLVEKGLYVDVRTIRDGLNRLDKMERNASR